MVPLQAILLADSITTLLEPITLEFLIPSANAPMIDHKLAWLKSVNVEEVFVLSHSKQIMEYLDKSKWVNEPNFSVTTIESHNCTSAGEALRLIGKHNVIQSDFILVSGDIVTNMMLTQALEEHKEKNALMTKVIKQSKSCQHGIIMAIDPTTNQLLHYEDKSTDDLKFNKSYLTVNPCFTLHNDKQDCNIDICSPQVLSLFMCSSDYQHPRDFVKVDDKHKIFTHEIHSSYYAEFLYDNNNNNPSDIFVVDDKLTDYEMFTHEIHSSDYAEFNNNPLDIECTLENKVEDMFLRGLFSRRNLARELQRFQSASGMALEEFASALFYTIMKFALDNSEDSGSDLVKETRAVISKWGRLLKPYSRAQRHVMMKFEEMCLESAKEYAPLFGQVLRILYDKDIIQEEAILDWAEHADESNKLLVKQSEGFIQWLKEVSEEKSQENDLKRLNEDAEQVKKSRLMKADLKSLNEGGVQCLSIC